MSWAHLQGTAGFNTNGPVALTFSSSVAAENLLVVGVCWFNTGGTNPIISVTDSGGNTWHQASSADVGSPQVMTTALWYCAPTTGGALVVTTTFTSSPVYASMSIDEYSHTPGDIFLTTTSTNNSGLTSTTNPSTGSMSFTGNALSIGSMGAFSGTGTYTPGAGYTVRETQLYSSGVALNLNLIDDLNTVTGSENPSATQATASSWSSAGGIFQSEGDVFPFAISPTTVTHSSSGNTLTLTGTGTSWTAGTPGSPTFTAAAGTITAQVVHSATSATLTYTAPGSGPVIFTDPSTGAQFSLGISGGSPTFSVSPSTSANAQSVTYTLTGSSTSWVSGSTTFGISGVTGASITSQSCSSSTAGSVTVLLDSTHTGTLTFTDSVDAATATSVVTLAAPGAPSSPSCTSGNTQNVLNWSAPTTGGLVATYNVYRGTTPGGESGTPIVTGLTSPTYTDTGLTNGQIYYYTIKAVNATATGVASSEVSGTPSASTLVSGTASLLSVGNTIASVTVGNATGGTAPYTYQWYRSTTSGFTPGGGNIVVGATSQTLNDTGLTNGMTYFYKNVVTDSA